MPLPLTTTIYTRDDFAAAWTVATDLDVVSCTFSMAPTIATATLRRRFGAKLENGSATIVTALDLRGKLLRIDLSDGTTTRSWYGYCPRPVDRVFGSTDNPISGAGTVSTGETLYQCFGLEFFLRQHTYDRCIVTGGSILRTAQPFNRRASQGRGTAVVGYRAAAKSASAVAGMPTYYRFDATTTTEWTALDVVEHILEVFGRTYAMAITLGSQYASLANVKGAWDLEGRSYYEALNAVINPRTGYAWYLIDRTLHVVTVADSALAGGLIPANANVVTLNIDTTALIDDPTVEHIETSHYDEIEVRGEHLRVCCTLSYQYGSLDKGWTTAEQTAYNALSAANTDKEGQEHIFCRLVIPEAWNQETHSGPARNAMPVIDTDDGAVDTASKQTWFRPSLSLDRNLPLLDTKGNPRRPLVYVNDGGTYRRLDKPGTGEASASVRVLDDLPGILLDGAYPHQFGLNHYTGADTREKSYDWQQVYATVGYATTERVRILITGTPEPGPITKRKIIDIPDAHLWYIVPGTATDLTSTGPVTHAGGYARDDRPLLERIAALAAAWYGRPRAAINLPYQEDTLVPRLGHVISETYSGGVAVPTGTVITLEQYDIDGRRTTIRSEFFELDPAAVLYGTYRGGGSGPARTLHRLQRVEEQLPNIPVRQALTAASAGGGTIAAKIVSKVSNRTYLCDLYANGIWISDGVAAAATATGQTVIFQQLNTGQTIPANTVVQVVSVGGHYEGIVPVWL